MSTVGRNRRAIEEYIRRQLQEDYADDQMSMKEFIDPFTGKAFTSDYSPWRTNYEQMALKTVLKRLLKTAPVKSDFRKAISMDETIKEDLGADMSEVQNVETEYIDVDADVA